MSTTVSHHPIFQPFRLGGHELSGRTVVAPMSRVSATPEGIPTGVMSDYYTAFAKGGFNLIITEGLYTDTISSQGYAGQPGIATEAQATAWAPVTASVKAEGALFIAQLMHAGALSQYLLQSISPSAVQPTGSKMVPFGGSGAFMLPVAMQEQDIINACEGYVRSAAAAWQAGFDGVEIHAANGYLPDQFITPHTNLREDQYGGSITNRFRFTAMIIEGIRNKVPDDFIIGVRLSEGKVNDLGYRWPEGAAMARALLTAVKAANPDYIHIAVQSGNWAQDACYADGSTLPGIARSITGKPVIANGGMHDLALSAKVLEEGHADLVAIGRAALADPQWPDRIRYGIPVTPFHRDMIFPDATIKKI